MKTLYLILLIVAAIIVFIGILRLIFDTPSSFTEGVMQFFLIDWMCDILVAIFDAIGNIDDSWD